MKIFSAEFVSKLGEGITELMQESAKELEEALSLNDGVDIGIKIRLLPDERGAIDTETTLNFVKERVKRRSTRNYDTKQLSLWADALPLRRVHGGGE